MKTYLERYLAGEHEAVWYELVTLLDNAYKKGLYEEMLAVANETMSRANYNIKAIAARLKSAGYYFVEGYERALVPPQPNVADQINKLEQMVGVLPISLRMWYEHIGEVDLRGTHPQWKVRAWDEHGTIALQTLPKLIATEPLQVYGIDSQLARNEGRKRSSDSTYGTILIAQEKDMRSGFNSVEANLMYWYGSAADGIINSYPNHEFFIDYLRRSFEWGGFPGFAKVDESLRPTAMLEYLKEGLLPI